MKINQNQIKGLKLLNLANLQALKGVDGDLAYCNATQTLYKYITAGGAYTADNLYVVATGDGGTTRWLGMAGNYILERVLGPPAPTITEGAIFENQTQIAPVFYGDATQQIIQRTIWSQSVVNVIPAATIAATSAFNGGGGAGIGSLSIPASFWKTGRTLKLTLAGYITRTANGTLTPNVTVGGVSLINAVASAALTTSGTWWMDLIITAVSPTSFWAQGVFSFITTANAVVTVRMTLTTPAATTVATPTSIDVTFAKGTANTLTIGTTNAVIEVMG